MRRLAVTILFMTAVAVAAYFAVLPAVLHSQIREALHASGIDDAQFTLGQFGPSGITISGISLGRSPWLQVDSMDVQYSVDSLLHKRVKLVHAHRVEWRVRINSDGSIDFGPKLQVGSSNGSAAEIPL